MTPKNIICASRYLFDDSLSLDEASNVFSGTKKIFLLSGKLSFEEYEEMFYRASKPLQVNRCCLVLELKMMEKNVNS